MKNEVVFWNGPYDDYFEEYGKNNDNHAKIGSVYMQDGGYYTKTYPSVGLTTTHTTIIMVKWFLPPTCPLGQLHTSKVDKHRETKGLKNMKYPILPGVSMMTREKGFFF